MSDQGKGSASTSAAAPAPGSDTYKGWLFKWTNYLKGYQRRWFVLSNGLLSYYRTQAEMAHTCRGTINLATAHIDTEDACNIVLSSGGRTYHLKASTEVERQRWVTALELAKAKAIRMMNDQSGASKDLFKPGISLQKQARARRGMKVRGCWEPGTVRGSMGCSACLSKLKQ
ncbi:unnamed protein product, partial [Gadus morhua 'NCC']